MPLRALFFDFDGLIVDTETPEVEVWQEVFHEQGVEFPDSYWINAIGRGADEIEERPIQLLAQMVGEGRDYDAIEADYKARVHARIDAQPILPGIVDIASEAKAEGLSVAVVSSSGHSWVDPKLERLGIAHLFHRTVCREDAPRAKPHPDLYLQACASFGIDPRHAVTFEDSPNGLHAANAAGVFGVAVPNSMTTRLDLSHAPAKVESLAALTLPTLFA